MKFKLQEYCVSDDSSIKNAMEVIDKNLIGAALVVNNENQVVGIITDGDIRRAILKAHTIDQKIEGLYNKNFKFLSQYESREKAKECMLKFKIRQMPVLDGLKRLVDIYFLDEIITTEEKDNYVFILAGGLGKRLRPLTETIPKPMLNVGDKPLLEHIIEQFKGFGFHNFIVSLNYKGEIIEDYFNDGSKFDVNIEYVRETKQLGTAGSIKLAKEKLNDKFIVINGDILTGIDFDNFLNYHLKNKFDITVGVRNYQMKVPYGVMVTDDNLITSLEEKPTYNFYINSGVYALNPEVIDYIPDNEFYNMTDLIEDVMNKSGKAGVYQITEYWTDIGQIDDFKKANEDIKKFF